MESTPLAPPAASEHPFARDSSAGVRAAWLGFGLLLLLFAPTLLDYGGVWMAQPYTHGWLIAAAVVWMVWNERDALSGESERWWIGALAVAGVSFLWLLGAAADMRLVVLTALPLIFLGWGATVYPNAALRLAPIAATALLAVPLWEALTPALQGMTIAVNAVAMRILGIPATIEGNLVHLEHGTFVIESGCAGLNYFMSGLTIGALYAYAFARRLRTRVAIVGLAALLATVGNWVRVSSLIALGEYTQMQSIFVTDSLPHITYGWSIFCLGLLIFLFAAGRVVRTADELPARNDGAGVPAGQSSRPTARSLATATMAASVGPVLFYAIAAVPARELEPMALAPASAGWSVAEAAGRPYAWEPEFVGADEHVASVWENDTSIVVVDRIVYYEQEQGSELVGYLNRIAEPERVMSTPASGHAGNGRIVNVVVVRDESAPILVWYWYRVGGIETASATKAKLLEIPAFFARLATAELIAVSAACAADNCAAAAQALMGFMNGETG